ncbi:MAG: hypothetical protein IPG39_22105 [Bacteroidetes bacterium]|nr:hypothetical protein [Bacteroidota bacterium]
MKGIVKNDIELIEVETPDRNYSIFKLLTSIRIPDELMYEVKDKFAFKVGVSNINEELAISFAKSYKGLIRRIEDKIKECIRSNSVLKPTCHKQ